MRTPCRSVRLVATCLTALLWAAAAEAQERLEVITLVDDQVRLVELDATVSGFGRILDVQRLPRSTYPASPDFFPVPAPPVVVSGGRYVVWTQAFSSPELPGQVIAFDRRTRRIFDASSVLPRNADGGPVRFVRMLAADPRRPRLFLSS